MQGVWELTVERCEHTRREEEGYRKHTCAHPASPVSMASVVTNSRVTAAAPAAFYEYDDPNILYIFVASTILAVIVLLYTGMSFDPSKLDAEESAPESAPDVLTLHTPRLLLRPFRPQDAAVLPSLCGDAAVARMCALVPHPYAPDDARFFIEHVCADPTNLTLAITDRTSGRVLGCVSLDGIHGKGHAATAFIGYWLGKSHWGAGVVTEAGRAIVAHGFTSLGLASISGTHFVENPASGRVMGKLGFCAVADPDTGDPMITMRQSIGRGEGSGLLATRTLRITRAEWRQARQRRQREEDAGDAGRDRGGRGGHGEDSLDRRRDENREREEEEEEGGALALAAESGRRRSRRSWLDV